METLSYWERGSGEWSDSESLIMLGSQGQGGAGSKKKVMIDEGFLVPHGNLEGDMNHRKYSVFSEPVSILNQSFLSQLTRAGFVCK